MPILKMWFETPTGDCTVESADGSYTSNIKSITLDASDDEVILDLGDHENPDNGSHASVFLDRTTLIQLRNSIDLILSTFPNQA